MIKVLEVQETPNPDALKFIVDKKLVTSGAKSFEDSKAGAGDVLAAALFAAGPVASVFYMDRFVTVTKFPEGDWNDLHGKIVEAVQTNARPAEDAATADQTSTNPDAMLDKIHAVLDENIRPALAGDGGGLEVLSYKDYVLSVHYQGACGSCPSAASGTLFAIENLLQRMVDPRIRVESA